MIDQIVAATEDFRQIKAQNASYKQGKNYLMQLVFENRQTIKATNIEQALVENNAGQASYQCHKNDDAIMLQRQELQIRDIKNGIPAKKRPGNDGCRHSRSHGGQ